MLQSYRVTGMHCNGCIVKIRGALQEFSDSIEVTLSPPKVVLNRKTVADLAKLNAALAQVGEYTLTPLTETLDEKIELQKQPWISTYYPLILILGMLAIVSFAGASNFYDWMLHFMAAFFLLFGSIKLLDLRGFSEAYANYDLLASYWKGYGTIYPFLELGLGFAFLFQVGLTPALWLSLLLMGFSSLGVIKALATKRKIRCACLGSLVNLPMSTVTLVEDVGMAGMALAMLLWM